LYIGVFLNLGILKLLIDKYQTKLAVLWIQQLNQPINQISDWTTNLHSII